MKTLMELFVLIILMLFHCESQSQSQVVNANLDPNENAIVGKAVTIKSKFTGLPLVEPHISAHPANNDHLLVAAMVVTDVNNPYESCRLSSFISKDGGTTWTETAHNWWGYDPWTAMSSNGHTVMAWIGTKGSFQDQYPIQFFTSDDGGITWNDNVQTLGGGHDGTKLAALNEEFYFTTVRFRNDMGADVILYRKAGKAKFEEVARIDGKGERLNFCEPAMLSDGTVIVPASHFLKEAWIQSYDHTTKKLSNPRTISKNPGGARGYMRLVVDLNVSSPFRDRLYFVRAVGTRERYEGIWLNYSTDKGETWSTDTRIDLFEKSIGSKAIVASVAVNKDGILGISWVDAQHDPAQQKNDLYFAISKDGGKSFQRPVRVTSVSSNPKTNANADVANKFPGGGHYLNIATKLDGSFQVIWSDSRSGIFELQTCNISIK